MGKLESLESELKKEQANELSIMGDISECETLIKERFRATSDIQKLQDRIAAVQLNNERLSLSLDKLNSRLSDAIESIGNNTVEDLEKKLNDEFAESDKLKKQVDNIERKSAERVREDAMIGSVREKILKQKKLNETLLKRKELAAKRLAGE